MTSNPLIDGSWSILVVDVCMSTAEVNFIQRMNKARTSLKVYINSLTALIFVSYPWQRPDVACRHTHICITSALHHDDE